MRAVLYVFSGTGNTARAGELIAAELRALGYETDVAAIRTGEAVPDPAAYDLVGFGYPIHAFNCPQFAQRYARALKPARPGTPCFVFKTSGEPFRPNSASSCSLCRILRRKGLDVLSDTHMLMPYNIMFRYPDGLARQMWLHTRAMAALTARRAAAGERDRLRFPLDVRIWAWLLRLQWFGAWVMGVEIHAKKDLCVGCGKCASVCPTNNVTVRDGKAVFGPKCAMCMGCTMACPRDAVRTVLLDTWRVNGAYPFEKLAADTALPADYVADARGYFHLFAGYYARTGAVLAAHGIEIPRDNG